MGCMRLLPRMDVRFDGSRCYDRVFGFRGMDLLFGFGRRLGNMVWHLYGYRPSLICLIFILDYGGGTVGDLSR